MKLKPVIIGIDPGTHVLGYGIIVQTGTRLEHVHSGAIVAKRTRPLHERLREIHEGLTAVLETFAPTHAAVEGVFAFKNVQSTVALAHARGIALLVCAQRGIDVAEYSPTEVKSAAVGYGRAGKDQVAAMMKRLFPAGRAATKQDTFDALAVAFCHLQFLTTRTRIAEGTAR